MKIKIIQATRLLPRQDLIAARLLFVALMLFSGCSPDENSNPGDDNHMPVQFSTQIVTPDTRITADGTAWEAGDRIGIFMLHTGGTLPGGIVGTDADAADNRLYKTTAGATASITPYDASQTIYYPPSGHVDFIAYYPWRTTPGSGPYLYQVSVAEQSNPAQIDVLYSNNLVNKARSHSEPAVLKFTHALAKLVINVKAGAGMGMTDFSGIGAVLRGFPATAGLSLADGATFTNYGGASTDLLPLKREIPTPGYVATFEAIVIPQSGTNTGRTVVFSVGGDYTWTVGDGVVFGGGNIHTYEVTVNESDITVNDGTITPWTGTGGGPAPGTVIQLPEMVLIPKGSFLMGSSDGSNIGDVDGTGLNVTPAEPDRNPSNETQHRVTLTKDFYMTKYTITNTQYAEFLNGKGVEREHVTIEPGGYYFFGGKCTWGENNGQSMFAEHSWGIQWDDLNGKWMAAPGYENHPVIYVTWYGAYEYAGWVGGALPTEAQWEYACRGGYDNRPFGVGDGYTLDNTHANFNWQYSWSWDGKRVEADIIDTGTFPDKTQEVGSYSPNALGLYDMHGNVMEWCADFYDTNYGSANANDAVTDPTGPAIGYTRIFRGGHCVSYARFCRSAYRSNENPMASNENQGFRVVFAP